MKNYWIVAISCITLSLFGFGVIIYKCFIQRPEAEILHLYYLNTGSMKEAGTEILNRFDGPAIISIFPSNEINASNDTIPWADVFVCNARTTSPDSNVIVLDIQTNKTLKNIKEPSDFWTDIKAAKKYKKCKVLISQNEIDTLKKYNYSYKYGNVTLVTDDND